MKTPLFNKYLSKNKYEDKFGYHPIWNAEVEKWLSIVDYEYLEKYKRRFGCKGREKQRGNFLAELCVCYYLVEVLGWNLKKLSPIGKGNHELEYLFDDTSGKSWYCEVKNSSWEAEVMNRGGDLKGKLSRIEKPKYIRRDGRSFAFEDSYITQIRKADKQFKKRNNNLLVIVPDTFVSPLIDPNLSQNVRDAISEDSPISTVAFLEICLSLGASKVEYRWKLINL